MIHTQPHDAETGGQNTAGRTGLRLLTLVFLFSVFVNMLMLTGPLFMLQIYDRVLTSRSEETLLALFLLVGFFYALMAMLDFARGRIAARCGARIQTELDSKVFDRATCSRSDSSSSDRALNDPEIIQTMFAAPAFLAFFDVIWTPFFLALIFLLHPVLGWVALAGGMFLIAITVLNHWLTRQRTRQAQTMSQTARHLSQDADRAHEIVQTQAMAPAIRIRWMQARFHALNLRLAASDVSGGLAALTKSARLFLQSSMLAVGAYYVLHQEVSAGAMIASSIILGRALSPLEQVLAQWPLFQQSFRAWRSLSSLLPDDRVAPASAMLPRPEAILRFEKVSVAPTKTSLPVLHGVSFELRPGRALGVIGRSGSGKTCLAKSALGYWPALEGQVKLGRARLHHYPPLQVGHLIGYLPQHLTFFSGTIADNIARMAPDADAQGAIAAAKRAGAHDMVLDLPDGYGTHIDAEGGRLSGGQRQRIALARALFTDPAVLILDEPNSALDADGSAALNQAIREFKALGNSVLVLTHRPAAISECNDLIILENGRIISCGPRDEVLRAQIANAEDVGARLRAS